MSSVVWKNLQLFDCAEERNTEGKKSGKEVIISAVRCGVKKSRRKARDEQFKQKSTILGSKGLLLPSLKHSGPKFDEENEDQIVQENLSRLQSLSQISAIDLKIAVKILERTTKRIAERSCEQKKITSTLFTEADFVSVLLVYYTLWIVGLPFAGPDDLFTRLFPNPWYALVVPAYSGLVFISSLTLFTVYSIYHNTLNVDF
ncbi:Hypothetical predicted protein [Cloeon dipterum]|uniref:Dolichol phosphate-mannose biosynthesis regulatory protein n=1 Tax=Cloeon dipterum TaxID=197152 RepID=A0A8S1CNT5_9INSE|nr:Hypothetical predicted protein [Cloeon dipterum]